MWDRIADHIPRSGSTAVRDAEAERDKVWSSYVRDGNNYIIVPSNLASLVDNPLVIAIVAASKVLNMQPVLSSRTYDSTIEYDKKQKMYLYGVAWGLNSDKKGSLQEYSKVSGPMGHGFYWVAHTAIQSQIGSSFWAKGKGRNPTLGTTGKAWAKEICQEDRRAFSILRQAAASLDVNQAWPSYLRPKESFLGREIKKELKFLKSGLLRPEEVEWINQTFPGARAAREQALEAVDSKEPDLDKIRNLSSLMKAAGTACQKPEILADRIIGHRINLIYPRGKRERKNALKRPLKDLIEEMDPESFIKAFDPTVLAGVKAYQVTLPDRYPEDIGAYAETIQAEYTTRLNGLRRRGYESLAELCESFRDNYVTPGFIFG
jgi:hypothetical protein